MVFVRLAFLLCLVSFAARQFSDVVRVVEKPKVVCESTENDADENQDEYKKKSLESLYSSDNSTTSVFGGSVLLQQTRRLRVNTYDEFQRCPSYPPPDLLR